jgi:alpha-L-arabinofuranosidase
VNPHVTERREAEIAVPGATIRSATATVLTNSDIHAHNTFAERKAVVPANSTVEIKGTPVRYGFPPASVTRLVMTLA